MTIINNIDLATVTIAIDRAKHDMRELSERPDIDKLVRTRARRVYHSLLVSKNQLNQLKEVLDR